MPTRSPSDTALETENDRRICKQLAEHIAEVVKREGADGWSFAAPASIHSSVTELLPAPISARVVEHVKSDLVKIEPAKLHEALSLASAALIFAL